MSPEKGGGSEGNPRQGAVVGAWASPSSAAAMLAVPARAAAQRRRHCGRPAHRPPRPLGDPRPATLGPTQLASQRAGRDRTAELVRAPIGGRPTTIDTTAAPAASAPRRPATRPRSGAAATTGAVPPPPAAPRPRHRRRRHQPTTTAPRAAARGPAREATWYTETPGRRLRQPLPPARHTSHGDGRRHRGTRRSSAW